MFGLLKNIKVPDVFTTDLCPCYWLLATYLTVGFDV